MTFRVATQKCNGCKFYNQTNLYELCLHKQSGFMYLGQQEFHTIQHMRAENHPCGLLATLFQMERYGR